MSKELLISSFGLAFFIICPRMAGMVHVIAGHTKVPLLQTALIGIVVAVPLLLIMVLVFKQTGIWGALTFCVATDIGAALFMKEISLSAGIETIVIAVFVIIGVKVAPIIAATVTQIFN